MSKNLIPTKLRSGDEVIVIAGKDIGKKGTLREIVRSKNKAIVTGINMVKKFNRLHFSLQMAISIAIV